MRIRQHWEAVKIIIFDECMIFFCSLDQPLTVDKHENRYLGNRRKFAIYGNEHKHLVQY